MLRRVASLFTALVASSLFFFGCKSEPDESPAAVAPPGAIRCRNGIERALKAKTSSEATSIYYGECSALFSQAACSNAWREAAKLPVAQQIPKVADPCRKAYCPSLTAFSFEACRDDFSATPENLVRAWPPLFDAIISREAGAAAPVLSSSMLVLYARLAQLEKIEPPGSASAAPPSSASAAPPSSASAAPPGSASAAPPPGSPSSSARPERSANPPAPSGSAKGGPPKSKSKAITH